MRIVVAPDSFKGSLSAKEAAAAMKRGIRLVFPSAEVVELPVADGGEGTVDVLTMATKGEHFFTLVEGPLGNPVQASWGMLGDGTTAVIEMAAASGIMLLSPNVQNPLTASTYGTGQLIRAVLDKGVKKIIIGIGGSATNDGGAGMAEALGVRFLDEAGQILPRGGRALSLLHRIDIAGLDPRLSKIEISIASDVDNPLCGKLGASVVFGPQKGATPEAVEELDAALDHYAAIAKRDLGKDVRNIAGAGAAGGLGAGLMLFTSGEFCSGIELVLDICNFEATVSGADFVLTGEGYTDFQTAHGKVPVGVAQMASRYKTPVICLSGGLGKGAESVLKQGVTALMSSTPQAMTLKECMEQAGQFVQSATERACRLLLMGMKMERR